MISPGVAVVPQERASEAGDHGRHEQLHRAEVQRLAVGDTHLVLGDGA